MKRTSGHILCLLLAITYVFGYMGFGIHTCHDDGSRHFVWMLGDVSCEAIHHHSHGEDHEHHHDGGCCSTQIYVLTDSQDNAPGIDNIEAPVVTLPLLAEAVFASPLSPRHGNLPVWDSPPPITPPTLSFLSVWLV